MNALDLALVQVETCCTPNTTKNNVDVSYILLPPGINLLICRFKNLLDNNDNTLTYSYNPCRTFQDVDSCANQVFVSVCSHACI